MKLRALRVPVLMRHLDINGVSGKGKIRSEKWWKELAMVMKNYKLIEVGVKNS